MNIAIVFCLMSEGSCRDRLVPQSVQHERCSAYEPTKLRRRTFQNLYGEFVAKWQFSKASRAEENIMNGRTKLVRYLATVKNIVEDEAETFRELGPQFAAIQQYVLEIG